MNFRGIALLAFGFVAAALAACRAEIAGRPLSDPSELPSPPVLAEGDRVDHPRAPPEPEEDAGPPITGQCWSDTDCLAPGYSCFHEGRRQPGTCLPYHDLRLGPPVDPSRDPLSPSH